MDNAPKACAVSRLLRLSFFLSFSVKSKKGLLHNREIDYYGVTFDHLVPPDDHDPEVLQINIIEVEDDNGVFANKYMDFHVDPAEYAGKRILAVPRCCQKRKGSTDRGRVNENVDRKEGRVTVGHEKIKA